MDENWPLFIPVCPYCQSELKGRQPPQRASTFTCPACHESIYVRPRQNQFPSMYLTAVQSEWVELAARFRGYPFNQFSISQPEAYQARRLRLKARTGVEPEPKDVIWMLALDALTEAKQRVNAAIDRDRKRLPGVPLSELAGEKIGASDPSKKKMRMSVDEC